jgi:predicted alpha/beta-fold hydrolase
MPLLESKYKTPFLFRNYHISTIYASMLRKSPAVHQERERLELEDGDFIDIDWSKSKCKSQKLTIVLHGLEGNSQRPYVWGMAKKFNLAGWDVAAVNLRGCSGELNRLFRSYNAGASEDLVDVIAHVLAQKRYDQIALVGFSLGGNLMLKYIGENNKLPNELVAAVAISTPCDLHQSLKKLEEPKNRVYSQRFVTKLKQQLLLRQSKYPDRIKKQEIMACKSLFAIDELYTGKAHGFDGALDYYEKNSALSFIPNITVPTLLINAQNDEFLSANSSPVKMANNNPYFYLEMPKFGGHVGFLQNKKTTYAEDRALEFVTEHI